MKRYLAYLLSAIGSLIVCWYFATFFWGWSPNPILPIFRAVVLAAAVWLAGAVLVRGVRHSAARVWLMCGILVLAALVLIPPVFHEHEPNASQSLFENPLVGFLLTLLLPCLALILAAILLYTGLKLMPLLVGPPTESAGVPSRRPQDTGGTAAVALALGGLVLAGGLYHLYWLFVWDSTYDSIDILFLTFSILVVLFAAAPLIYLASGRLRLTMRLYAILSLTSVIVVFLSAKQVDYRLLTEARAERVSQALEQYHARWDSYPDFLNQLVPWTILSLPGPVVIYGQDWCYQGTKEWFRLGYVDRDHWSSPELFSRVFTTKGSASDANDLCDAEIAILKERYPDFYGVEGRRN